MDLSVGIGIRAPKTTKLDMTYLSEPAFFEEE
jgi:hypothetical protein